MPVTPDYTRRVKGLWWNAAEASWHYDFRVTGHRFRGSARTGNQRDAEKHVQQLRRQAEATASESAGLRPMTFLTASSRWFVEKGGTRARPHEIERDLAWLQTAIGHATLIRAIDSNAIARLVSLRQADGVAPGSVNRTMTEHLRAILSRARDVWGQPVARIAWKDHMLKEPRIRIREASAGEESRLIAAMRADYRPVMQFDFLSGLRLEELTGMMRDHIHFGERRLYLQAKGGHIQFIPLTDAMIRILREQLVLHNHACVWTYQPHRRRTGQVLDLTRQPITYQGLKTQFRRARTRAGLPSSREDAILGYRLHDTRHTALSRVSRNSLNGLLMAQQLGRHADIKTTMRYVHAGEDELRQAMEAVETSRKSSHKAPAEHQIIEKKQEVA